MLAKLPLKFFAAASVLVVASQVTLLGDPGFGLLKKRKLMLQVRQPAAVRLANTSIGFRGSVTNQEYSPVLGSLEATLETELVSNERSLTKKAAAAADWVFELRVTGFSTPPPSQRVDTVNNRSVTTQIWSGSLNVAYQVVDRSGTVHAADNIAEVFKQDAKTSGTGGFLGLKSSGATGNGPSSAEDVKQSLIQSAVRKIAASLGNTVQPVEALVAAGEDRLERAADFMDKALWARAIEDLEKIPPFSKPQDESYRQYNLGLAYEAMSYESKVYTEQRANLFKAQELYDKATEMNLQQDYFIGAVARTKESVARYRALDAMQKEDLGKRAPQNARSASPAPAAPAPPPAPSPATATGKALSVADVLELHMAGVDRQQIVELIRSSPGEYALLDKDSILAITKAKLPADIQNEMRKKAGLPPLTAAPRAGGAAAPRPTTPATAPAGRRTAPPPPPAPR